MKFKDYAEGITFHVNEDPSKGPVIVRTPEVDEWLKTSADIVYEHMKDMEMGSIDDMLIFGRSTTLVKPEKGKNRENPLSKRS